MRVTIKDIAEYTGLSITTISLVLNNKGTKIPQRTQDIIFEAVEKLDYRPNQIAVGLVKKRTNTIGLLVSDIRNVFFSNLAKGVEDECRKNGWNLILCNTSDKHENELEYIRVLADKGVDGILYSMTADNKSEDTKESLDLMNRFRIPYVMIDRTLSETNCCTVKTDHLLGGYLATKHLIELGHKRIACVTGPLYLDDTANRLLGYKKALDEAGIAYDESLVYEGFYTIESGKEAMEYLKERDYTAIFAFNDMMAYGVYNQCKKYNYKIPGDISLVGYDDIFFSQLLDVSLTTINQPVYDIGKTATSLIIKKNISKAEVNENVVFEPTLIIRESTKRR